MFVVHCSKPESIANGNGDVHQNNNVEIKLNPGMVNTAGAKSSQTTENEISKQANPAGNTFKGKLYSRQLSPIEVSYEASNQHL